MNIALHNLTNEELIDFAEKKLSEYEADRARGNHYGDVKLADIQTLEKACQRSRYSDRGAIIHKALQDTLKRESGFAEPKERKVKSPYEVHRQMNGFGRFNVTRSFPR